MVFIVYTVNNLDLDMHFTLSDFLMHICWISVINMTNIYFKLFFVIEYSFVYFEYDIDVFLSLHLLYTSVYIIN